MLKSGVQDVLGLIQKPSRYFGSEINSVQKDNRAIELRMVLAFPDLYEIGTSHFGIQILYHLLNQHQKISVERVYAPALDMQNLLRENHWPLFSLESKSALSQFDIIGFSLLYELNYTNVLNMLDLAEMPLRWESRNESHPLVIAGGPCVCNPEPMADFFDAMVFGDGEQIVLDMAEQWLQCKARGDTDKRALLRKWADIEGVYVPRFFKTHYDADGFQHIQADADAPRSVHRTIIADLDKAYFPKCPVIPFGKPIHDRLRIEISRGCSRGCRFCQAGMIYRPVRERSAATILDLVQSALENTGYDDLSLLSLSTGDYTCLGPLMENLMQICRQDRIAVSLPSLRAGVLSPKLMKLIRSVRKTGFTIAPEAGSQRLRDVINKNITFEDVENTVKDAFNLGWRVIKLYFMIGLPTETDDDLDAIADMVHRLKNIKGANGRKGQINVSITTFVPKPHTPFQWACQISLDESQRRIEYIKSRLKISNVRIKWQHPQMSLLEGILARGDRRVSHVIEQAWKNGCLFDGWNDQLKFDLWQDAFEHCGLDGDFFTIRKRGIDEPLPWEHMNAGVDHHFLVHQWQSATKGERLQDCRYGECHGCGVCDFKNLRPVVFTQCPVIKESGVDAVDANLNDESFTWMMLTYSKLGQSRFLGHLELNNIFARAVRRAKISVQYTRGFHPMPRISFDDPLPLGMASEGEHMRIKVSSNCTCQAVQDKLNMILPNGVRIIDCYAKKDVQRNPAKAGFQKFRIELNNVDLNLEIIHNFEKSQHWPYRRQRYKRPAQILDMRSAVHRIHMIRTRSFILEINTKIPIIARPADFLEGVLKLTPDQVQKTVVTKLVQHSE